MSVLISGGVEVNDDVGKANLLNRTFADKFASPDVSSFSEGAI